MKTGRQCRDCQVAIHKKCEEKFNATNSCTHEPIKTKSNLISPVEDEDAKGIVNVELPTGQPATTPTEENEPMVTKSTLESATAPAAVRLTTPTTATRLSNKAAAAFSVLDSTARRSFRAFGPKTPHSTAPSAPPTLATTSELSKSDESLSQASTISSGSTSTKAATMSNTPGTSSKLAHVASSAYSKLREFKAKRTHHTTAEASPSNKPRSIPEPSKCFTFTV